MGELFPARLGRWRVPAWIVGESAKSKERGQYEGLRRRLEEEGSAADGMKRLCEADHKLFHWLMRSKFYQICPRHFLRDSVIVSTITERDFFALCPVMSRCEEIRTSDLVTRFVEKLDM